MFVVQYVHNNFLGSLVLFVAQCDVIHYIPKKSESELDYLLP